MKVSYELNVEDMKKAIADYLHVEIPEVSISVKSQCVGYGMAEHNEYVPYCIVTKFGDKDDEI